MQGGTLQLLGHQLSINPRQEIQMNSKTATIQGIKMRWTEHGEGVPLVLIHGIPTSPALWRHVMPEVRGAHCLAFEMVGYGDSMGEHGHGISVAHQAQHLIAWLDHLGIEKAIFAGHDLGGGVAQIAAVRYPHRCSGLFLTNSICYDSWPIPSVNMLRASAPLVSVLPDAAVKQIMRVLMIRGHDDSQCAREALDVHWPPYARNGAGGSLVRQVKSLNVADTIGVAAALSELKVPARVVWGVDDKFQKLSYGERLAQDLRAPLHRIEGGLHFTPEDHPYTIAGQLSLLVDAVR